MVKMSVSYTGDLHCELRHGPSGTIIQTDAPLDNHGKGAAFSPTDLMTVSLASCMMTTMAIAAQKENIELTGTIVDVEKEMVTQPFRRVGRITIKFKMRPGIDPLKRDFLESVALNCPVTKSLNTEVEVLATFQYSQ